MKTIRTIFLLALACLLLAPAYGGGRRERAAGTESPSLKDFTAIQVNSGITVKITQSKTFSVKATGTQSDLDRLQMSVRGQTLRLVLKSGWGGSGVHVDIAMPALKALQLTGGAQASMDMDATKQGRFAMDLSGGSRVEGTLLASDVSLNLSGGSRVAVGGYAMSLVAEVSGGSRFDCLDFAVDKAVLQLSGGSGAALAVQSTIAVDASGGSRLEYRGNPKVVQSLSGAASVQQTN
jgi:hypothetical protein